MYVANSARTLFATVGQQIISGMLVMSLTASLATAQVSVRSDQGVVSKRDAIKAQLSAPLGSVELVRFEIDATNETTDDLPARTPVVTLVPSQRTTVASAKTMQKQTVSPRNAANRGSAQQALVRYVAPDLKPKQARRLAVRSVSSLRTAVTKGEAAAVKAMEKKTVRQFVAAPTKLPLKKQPAANPVVAANPKVAKPVVAAKPDGLVFPDSSLDIPSPPINDAQPVVVAVESAPNSGGGLGIEVVQAKPAKPIPEAATKVKVAEPVGTQFESAPVALSPQQVNVLNGPTASPVIPNVPSNLPSNAFQSTPVPFAPQASSELGTLATTPELEPVPYNGYQTLPVAEAYAPDVPNAWVPSSSLTGTFLESASTLDTGYQTPTLFSHASESGSCTEENWPCSTCGQNICCCCQVRWRVRADALFLHRSRADGFDIPLIRKFGDGDRPTIDCNPDSFSMDFQGGPRFSLIRDNLCDGCDFEATYYLISQWDSNDFVNGDIATVGFTSIGFGRGDARYESRFQNAEANVFRDLNNWTQGMIGFRWLQFDEHASVTASTDLVPNFEQRVDTLNNLFGGQLGLRRRIWDQGGFTQVYATAKAGVFNNNIQRNTFGFGTTPLEENVASFVGELDFLANIEVTPCWSLQVGYQVIWVTGVAEALDQFFSPDEIFDDGAPILHGFRFGFTRTF